MIKNVLIIAVLLGTLGCGNSKNVDKGDDTEKTDTTVVGETPYTINTETEFIEGVVADRANDNGCQFIIQVNINGTNVDLEPGELDDQFKVDGKKVQLKYSLSKRQSLCGDTMPIIIIEIK